MIKKERISAIASCILLVAILSGLLASPAWGQQPERVKVLIAFGRQPGPAEQALVRGMGGSVKYSYHLVPAIAATLPEPAISALEANPHVTRVELDAQMRALDTELDNAWGVTRIGAGAVHNGGNKGAGVKLAIIDSGINYNHPDLDGNYQGGWDFVGDGDPDPMDVYGHGTHVAGTACAEDNDNGDPNGPYGVVGVAPACALYGLRVLDDAGYGDASDLIAAMEWAVDNGIQVANLSLGWDLNPGDTVKAALDNAKDLGLVIVAAACNNGNRPGKGDNVCYPALYDSVIAVAATDASDRRASFSSTGDQVELAAPGVSVFSTWNDDTGYRDPQPVCRLEEGLQTCYKYGSGTSMASPHVAGTAALILATNPDWTNDQVRAQLRA
ncbi:MAG: S8 family peptidase, partial [Anaerolineae bacterium]